MPTQSHLLIHAAAIFQEVHLAFVHFTVKGKKKRKKKAAEAIVPCQLVYTETSRCICGMLQDGDFKMLARFVVH